MKKWKIKKFAKNYIFAVIMFIIVSFFLDIYLLNYIPGSAANAELNAYPNILLIEIDALRADHLSLYDYSFNTSPNIDEFAKDAAVFDIAIGPASGSLPAISSIFTGKFLSHHGTSVINQELNTEETTFAEMLKAKGYNTAGFVAAIFYKAKYGIAQGFNTYKDRMDFFEFQHTFEWFGLRQTLYTFFPNYKYLINQDGSVSSSEVNENVFKWLDKNKHQPFFLYVHYADPHYPYKLNNEYLKDFRNNTESYPQRQESTASFEELTSLKPEDFFQLYDAAIKYSDSNVGKLLNKLDELNLKDNTLIIITADHGIEYYDHGIVTGESMYQAMIHVPLIIYYPKELKPQRIRTPVSTIDILPTLLDTIGFKVPEGIDGVSLLPLMKGKGPYGREFVASETYGRSGIEEALQQIAIIKGDWKLIEIRESEILSSGLYNLRTDPKEQRNLYDIYIEKRRELQQYIPEVTSTMEIEGIS
jgi:arylsulfatase